jgi:hypothetical protein
LTVSTSPPFSQVIRMANILCQILRHSQNQRSLFFKK